MTSLLMYHCSKQVVGTGCCIQVVPPMPDTPVVVVGDTHGQLHDVCSMLRKVGEPSEHRYFVFNGDFVDRGAWGLEVLMVLACWKLVYPAQVVILRGNHECTTCTHMYGFRGEVLAKYGPKHFKDVFKVCKKLFAALPLAAVVGGQTLVLHGGLFRKPHLSTNRRKKRRKTFPGAVLEVGSLEDLRAAGKGGLDPNGVGKSVVATDVLWSDPSSQPGLVENEARGVGLLFGPDITQGFLAANKLKLIIRSHEGPDARWKREGMQDMAKGHSLDHVTPEGNLMTVFSAPDYPQFQPSNEDRFNNLGAVAVLRGSHASYTSPELVEYSAVPRPQAQAFYMYEDVPDSDEEISIGHGSPSDLSAASSQAGSVASHASSADVSSAEVASRPSSAEEEAGPAAENDNAASNRAGRQADDQQLAHASLHDRTTMAASVSQATRLQSDHSPSVLAASQQLEAGVSPDRSGDADHSRQELNGTGPERRKAGQSPQLPILQAPQKPRPATRNVAMMPGVTSASAPASPHQSSLEHGVSEGPRKRKAATVFDQGLADQAEAADLKAGIAAGVADDVGVNASLPVDISSKDGHTADEMSTVLPDGARVSVSTMQTRKAQPRAAPWR
ncbi:hypothetical protein ABBQ38_001277 [Trebouxia sp. C0009 RCD-2024]